MRRELRDCSQQLGTESNRVLRIWSPLGHHGLRAIARRRGDRPGHCRGAPADPRCVGESNPFQRRDKPSAIPIASRSNTFNSAPLFPKINAQQPAPSQDCLVSHAEHRSDLRHGDRRNQPLQLASWHVKLPTRPTAAPPRAVRPTAYRPPAAASGTPTANERRLSFSRTALVRVLGDVFCLRS